MRLIDCHCHLTDEAFDSDRLFIINDLSNFAIRGIINPATNIEDSKKAIDLAEKYDNFYPMVGIHPENVDDITDKDLEELEILAKNPKVVAIGEIGLDYYWKDDNKDRQKEIFIYQLKLARKLDLPAVIHVREAKDDVIEILKDYTDLKIQIHCFSDDLKTLNTYMDMGFYISIGGVVTFSNGTNEKVAARNVPIERLMLETDSPYLTPEPYRGLRNDPRRVVEVARTVADLRDMKIDKLAKRCYKNTVEFFNL
ncbi:TatD family hydrolase [Anaerococcus urinomassiliensis]|uniref:TatD family hydrolase n=1 Tax=Anaerococcus urinomassiliensis TaxID=1745712 RepID=UPI0009392061|nr:TatD family hydrolase [Anaerococcus urinomassiliensis]